MAWRRARARHGHGVGGPRRPAPETHQTPNLLADTPERALARRLTGVRGYPVHSFRGGPDGAPLQLARGSPRRTVLSGDKRRVRAQARSSRVSDAFGVHPPRPGADAARSSRRAASGARRDRRRPAPAVCDRPRPRRASVVVMQAFVDDKTCTGSQRFSEEAVPGLQLLPARL